MALNKSKKKGLFVELTNILAVQNLRDPEDVSPALKSVLIDLYQDLNNMNIALNLKDGGYLTPSQFVNGPILYFNPQQQTQTLKCLVVFGALPNATTKSVNHDIDFTTTYRFIGISGAATNSVGLQAISMPYSSPTLNQNISVVVTNTYVTVTTAIDYSAYTDTLFILEYAQF